FPVNERLLGSGVPHVIEFVPKPVSTAVVVLSTGISVLPSRSITTPDKTALEKVPEMLPLCMPLARTSKIGAKRQTTNIAAVLVDIFVAGLFIGILGLG